jgi:hypothetical protein
MSAERGWIGDPQPERERTPPSHAYKWHKMMGAAELLPETPRDGRGGGQQRRARLVNQATSPGIAVWSRKKGLGNVEIEGDDLN